MEDDVEKAPYHDARVWPVHIYQKNKISKMETVPQVYQLNKLSFHFGSVLSQSQR